MVQDGGWRKANRARTAGQARSYEEAYVFFLDEKKSTNPAGEAFYSLRHDFAMHVRWTYVACTTSGGNAV